ncbi:MAG: sarcosine oxidase subunit delta [Hyphomicrobiales bacterium]|jgi:sarcosine oxidase subunit delta|nr:sarcosine oxidase subunit delta [Hyphomicrobiales bacterium]
MLRIACPYCGERDYVEFVYAGDASKPFPGLDDDSIDCWTDFVFIRDNPKGLHEEYWQHQSGCRQWLRVTRHTISHEVHAVTPVRDARHSSPVKTMRAI